MKTQSLMEARRMVYAKLLSTVEEEESYPRVLLFGEETEHFNVRLREWRRNRKKIKGLAAEAMLLVEDSGLKAKLLQFITTQNPEERLRGIVEIMRSELT